MTIFKQVYGRDLEDVASEWAAGIEPLMAAVERAATQTTVQFTAYSQSFIDLANSSKPFRRERERYLRRRRQTRATFHGK